MKTVIYKYEIVLGVKDHHIDIKGFIKVLSVVVQHNKLMLYAIVDPDNSTISRLPVYVKGTGWVLTDDIWCTQSIMFAGSFVVCNGDYVWHVWYDTNTIVRPEDNV